MREERREYKNKKKTHTDSTPAPDDDEMMSFTPYESVASRTCSGHTPKTRPFVRPSISVSSSRRRDFGRFFLRLVAFSWY